MNRRAAVVLLGLSALSLATPASARTAKRKGALAPRANYRIRLAELAARREELAEELARARSSKARVAVGERARTTLLRAFRDDLFPAWAGTKWAFYGTTTEPGEGFIACGYYVTTLLRDAGFDVERAKLAQQPSERIVKTMAPETEIERFRKGDADLVIDAVRKKGEGLYVVGLDNHVGLLDVAGDAVMFCHSTYVEKADVRREPAAESEVFQSRYHVVGRLLSPKTLQAWLRGRRFETLTT